MDPAARPMLGRYELLEAIGEGGFARVHRVRADGRELAAKILSPAAAELDPAARARFDREIRALERVRHPHLIELVDHGVDPVLGPYLVTPLIAGMTLRDVARGRGLCPEAALLLVEPVLSALAAMHAEGLVHRDLKPENVMVTPLGDVVLVDLGLALADAHSRLTEAGTVTGSVPYMSPEQIEGEPISPASDVWSIGVTLYERIAGRRPFERERPGEELASILGGSVTPLTEIDRRVSPDLGALVGRCLRRDPTRRPADAAALLEELEPHLASVEPTRRKAERTRVITDPEGYAATVAPRIVVELEAEARARLEGGEQLEAIRVLDRALAYDPDAGGVLALLDAAAAEAGSPSRAAEIGSSEAPADRAAGPARAVSSVPLRRRARWPAIAAAAVLAAAGIGGGWWLSVDRPSGVGPGDDERRATEAAAEPADQQARDGDDAPAESALPPELPDDLAAMPSLRADRLRNDDPRRPAERPAPGEPLIDRAQLNGRDPEEVLTELEAELAAHPDDRVTRLRHASALLAAGRTDEGLRRLRALGDAHPDDPRVLDYRAMVAYNQGREDEAERLYSRAIELAPERAIGWRNRGVLRFRAGRTRDAHADLLAALRRDPDDVDALAELARIYEAQGRLRDAAPALERIVRARPEWVPAWVDLSLAQTDPDAQLASVDRALSLSPRDPRALLRRCEILSAVRPRDAIAACDAAERLRPDDFSAPLFRGLARSRLGQTAAAIEDLDRAIELEPRSPELFHDRAILRRDEGDHAAARADFEVACGMGFRQSCTELGRR